MADDATTMAGAPFTAQPEVQPGLDNLVIVRAGRQSRHKEWVQGEAPTFDLIVLYYEEIGIELLSVASVSEFLPGSKVQGWSSFLSQNREVLGRYQRIALLDDDLSCSAAEINSVFAMGEQYGLTIWQPSLTSDSHFTYATFQSNFLFKLRYVNFIEMMCPFMTSAMLERLLPLLATGYETGIDRYWCHLIQGSFKACAVIDEISIRHTRSVGRDRAKQGFVGDDSEYQTVVEKLELLSGLSYGGTVAYAGLTRWRRPIKSRKLMAVLSVAPLIWIFSNPTRKYFKRFLISLKHNFSGTVSFEGVDTDWLILRLSS